jgi:hypothetical protein
LSSDGTVSESEARSGTGDAFLRRVLITNEAGEHVARVLLGQPFRVTCTYEVSKRLEDVVIELGVSTPDGMRIVTALSSDGGAPLLRLEPGKHEITVELDLTLLPHPQYVIDVAMHLLSGLTIDWVERAAQFAALNVAESGADNYPWQTVRGYVRPAARWFAPEPVKQ